MLGFCKAKLIHWRANAAPCILQALLKASFFVMNAASRGISTIFRHYCIGFSTCAPQIPQCQEHDLRISHKPETSQERGRLFRQSHVVCKPCSTPGADSSIRGAIFVATSHRRRPSSTELAKNRLITSSNICLVDLVDFILAYIFNVECLETLVSKINR